MYVLYTYTCTILFGARFKLTSMFFFSTEQVAIIVVMQFPPRLKKIENKHAVKVHNMYMYIDMHLYMYIYLHAFIHVHVHVHTFTCICTYTLYTVPAYSPVPEYRSHHGVAVGNMDTRLLRESNNHLGQCYSITIFKQH